MERKNKYSGKKVANEKCLTYNDIKYSYTQRAIPEKKTMRLFVLSCEMATGMKMGE